MTRALAVVACATFVVGACAADPQYKHADAGTGAGTGGRGGGSAGGTGGGTGTGGAGTGGALVDTTTMTYDADDPNIQYTGRVTFDNPKQPRFDLGGTSITTRFSGTAVAVTLKDEFRYGKYVNSYEAIIDGEWIATLVPRTNPAKIVIANRLAAGQHQITLFKRTESAAGAGYLVSFSFAGEILPPPARPTRRIEFLGDSITAGAGIDALNGAPACNALPDGWGLPVENAYLAFGPVVGRELEAEVHLMGISGIGLVRNYSNMYDARTLPQVYDLIYPEVMDSPGKMDQPRWDATKRMTWVPDAIVVGLGTNDFGQGDPSDTTQPYPHPPLTAAAFAAGHIAFAETLRGYYPNAHIFLLSTPALNPEVESALKMAEDHFIAAGDTKVHRFVIPKSAGRGCATHPDAAQHAEIAWALSPVIKTALGW